MFYRACGIFLMLILSVTSSCRNAKVVKANYSEVKINYSIFEVEDCNHVDRICLSDKFSEKGLLEEQQDYSFVVCSLGEKSNVMIYEITKDSIIKKEFLFTQNGLSLNQKTRELKHIDINSDSISKCYQIQPDGTNVLGIRRHYYVKKICFYKESHFVSEVYFDEVSISNKLLPRFKEVNYLLDKLIELDH